MPEARLPEAGGVGGHAARTAGGHAASPVGAHAAGLALLALVATWWVVLLGHAVRTEHELETRLGDLRARSAALDLAAPGRRVLPGPIADAPGLRVADAAQAPGGAPVPGTDLVVVPDSGLREASSLRLRRRELMVHGEGALLLGLVGVSGVLLARLALAERNRRRESDEFLARIAHEMKTPLAGLEALLQGLRDGRVPRQRRDELVRLGLQQAEREERLVDALIAAGRAARRTSAVPGERVDVPALLEEMAARRRELAGVAIEVDAPAGATVVADPGSLRTVLDNLLDNAVKYGARSLRLRAAHVAAGRLELVVEDDGPGFEPSRAEDLFRPFHRAATSAGTHGTGLGLPIARSLARDMGGDLRADSDGPGRGARFTVELPGSP